jgi:predicted PurR-regulated permease PerM
MNAVSPATIIEPVMNDVADGLPDPVAAQPARQDTAVTAAKAAAGAIAVVALAFGLWRVRSIVILLLLALTFAAAIRPGVEWLRWRRVPQSLAIGVFFVGVLGAFFLFFWLAIPPALHQITEALAQTPSTSGAAGQSTGIRHDVLAWVDRQLHELPSGSQVLHPVAAYGHKATEAVVAVFFTLAASWYWVSERDRMIDLLSLLAPEAKREKARQTYLAIDRRLGSYSRLKFIMIFVVGFVLSAGFYLVGLNYWLLLGGFVSLVEIVPVIGPLFGAILVAAVGMQESLHVAALGLLVLVGVREFQSYVINPHVMGHSVGLSPMVTLVSVSVVGVVFGGIAVVLAVPAASAVATLIDVFVLDHDPPPQPAPHRPRAISSETS